MNENSFKKDLFDDQVYESKARKLGLLSKYSKQRILSYISVPDEYIVIVSITALILMIISYAIGVERGKNIAGKMDENVVGIAKLPCKQIHLKIFRMK